MKFKRISQCELLKFPRYTFAAISGSICYFNFAYFEPSLAIRVKEFKLSDEQIGILFMVYPLFWMIASIISTRYIRYFEKRSIMITFMFLSVISNLCTGPSYYLRFPDSIAVIVIS